MKAIDFHTHIFPDSLAERAVGTLSENSSMPPVLDGRISSLLESMNKNNIEKSIVCSIATKPEQFLPILNWSREIRSDRIIPFISIHPEDKNALKHIAVCRAEGFKGIKIHPYYQNFIFNESRMFKFYEEVVKQDLILLTHAGYDIAFEKDRRVSPDKILDVKERYPELKLVAAHLGGWMVWEEVYNILAGKDIYLDLSYAIDDQNPLAAEIINKHDKKYLLFATDSPWADQNKYLEIIKNIITDNLSLERVLHFNAAEILI